MSTPPRDRSMHSASPLLHSTQPEGVSEATANVEGEAACDSVQRTDEIELLISAAVFFGLLQIPGRLVEWWNEWSRHQSASGIELGQMLMQIGYGLVFALLASFFVHLVLRAFWIGLIGLRSAFPEGVDWAKLARNAPITTEYQRANTPSIGSAIVRIDRAASIVFICAGLLVSMTLVGAALVIPLFFLGGRQAPWIFYAVLVLLMLPAILQLVLDQGLASRSPQWATKPWLRRIVIAVTAISSRVMPRGLLLAPLLTLQSRLPPVAFAFGLTITMMSVMLAFPLHLWSQKGIDSNSVYRVVDNAVARHGITRLAPLQSGSPAQMQLPSLDRVQVDGAFVELFVPLRPRQDDGALRARCPSYASGVSEAGIDSSAAGALRDCIAALWRITLDGRPIEPGAFDLARQGSQRGLLAMLQTSDLAPGRHQIVATRLPIRVIGQKLREPPPPHSLLFWVAR